MFEKLNDLKEFLRKLDEDSISFSSHFSEKSEIDRAYLTKDLVKSCLKDIEKISGFQSQKIKNEERYRIGIQLSNKYNLVIICKILRKGLYIITAWKSNRKWEKTIQK